MKYSIAYLLLLATSLHAAVLPQSWQEGLDRSLDRWANLESGVLDDNAERFVDYTNAAYNWNTKSDGTWCSGFVPGGFWYLFDMTGDFAWRSRAEKWTEGVRSRATATDNDTGFQVFDSFGLGIMFGSPGNVPDYTSVVLTGTQTLVDERWNEGIGCFRSWDGGEDNPNALPFEVNIDQLMNLEIILWSADNGGTADLVDKAVSHADKTWDHNVREDGSTFHVVSYNLDGTVASKRTHQGWTRDSTWSRGQAWAVYGYTMVYRYTQLPRMLDRAEACFAYFAQQVALDRDDYVPYSDFDAPLNASNPRDTSAAAIVASAALELYTMTNDPQYLSYARATLNNLCSAEYLTSGNQESVLKSASEKWGKGEVGAIFADYFLLEAFWRYENWITDEAIDEWHGFPVLAGLDVNTETWLGWINIEFDPWVWSYALNRYIYLDGPLPDDPIGAWAFIPKW